MTSTLITSFKTPSPTAVPLYRIGGLGFNIELGCGGWHKSALNEHHSQAVDIDASVGLNFPSFFCGAGGVLFLGGGASLPHSMWHLSSPIRDGTQVSCLGRQILNHGATQKVHMLPQLCVCSRVGVRSTRFYSLCRFMSPQPSCSATRSFILFIHSYIRHLSFCPPIPAPTAPLGQKTKRN